jgi:hypothetical protein
MTIFRPQLQEPTREERLLAHPTPHPVRHISGNVSSNPEFRELQIEYDLLVSAVLVKTVTQMALKVIDGQGNPANNRRYFLMKANLKFEMLRSAFWKVEHFSRILAVALLRYSTSLSRVSAAAIGF